MRWKTLAVLLPVGLLSVQAATAADLAEIRSLIDQGRSDEALVGLEEHLDESPVDPEAMFLRGLLLAETQHESEAMEVFEEISGLRPDRPEPLNNLAVIQAANGDYEAAVETLKEALRTHPAYRTAYENLTKIYGQLASEAYSRALSVEQAHTRSAVELVLVSDMEIPEAAVVRIAEAQPPGMPAEPLPVALDAIEPEEPAAKVPSPQEPAESAVGMKPAAEPVGEPAAEIASEAGSGMEPQAPMESEVGEAASPDEAIAEALAQTESVEDSGSEEPATAEEALEPGPAEAAARPGELANLVEAWARAWSEQRVEDYLYFYGRDFAPPGELSREDWNDQRRARLSSPEFVRVSVAFLDFESGAPDQATVRFNQSYESNTFSDVVTKTLELVREGGEWKIVKETVDS